MIIFIMILIFVLIVASTWWFGLWSNLITLINLFLASLVASSFYENVAVEIVIRQPTYIVLVEFVSLWLVFFVAFFILRAITDVFSKVRLKFDFWTETIGRSLLSVWIAGVFICFTMFSLQLAPLPPHFFVKGGDDFELPDSSTSPSEIAAEIPAELLAKRKYFGPDKLWAAFIQSRSRGALSEGRDTTLFPSYRLGVHPDDTKLNFRVFDPFGNFFEVNHVRRVAVSKQKILRVSTN
jgi:hypothetical protein